MAPTTVYIPPPTTPFVPPVTSAPLAPIDATMTASCAYADRSGSGDNSVGVIDGLVGATTDGCSWTIDAGSDDYVVKVNLGGMAVSFWIRFACVLS